MTRLIFRYIRAAVILLCLAASLLLYSPYSVLFYLAPSRRMFLCFITASIFSIACALPIIPPSGRAALGNIKSTALTVIAVGALLPLLYGRSKASEACIAVCFWIISWSVTSIRLTSDRWKIQGTVRIVLSAVCAAICAVMCGFAVYLWIKASASVAILSMLYISPVCAVISSIIGRMSLTDILREAAAKGFLIWALIRPLAAVEAVTVIFSSALLIMWITAEAYNLINTHKSKNQGGQ